MKSSAGGSGTDSRGGAPATATSSEKRTAAGGGVEVVKDKTGMPQLCLRTNRGTASAIVRLHGAQIVSWKTQRAGTAQEELLFISDKAIFNPPKAVRGGIQICFPQFGNQGTLEQHGFARNKFWDIEKNAPAFLPSLDFTGKVFIDLLLKPSIDDIKKWPHRFEFRLRISLAEDGTLTYTSRIRNVDNKNFSFSIAYHTYFSISDISEVRIEGLETLDYLDNLLDKKRFTERDSLTFESEVDRVYIDSSNKVAVLDHQKKRTFVMRKEGLPDVVVWNPWERKSKAMVDFGDEEYKKMLCLDAAAVEKTITLKPGEEWTGRVEFSVVPSS